MKKTVLIKLDKIIKYYHLDNNIYAVMGSSNPSGSIKDVPAYFMLEKRRENKELIDGGIVIEATSGNMGISLGYFQKELNYKAIIVMPSSMSEERKKMIKDSGAELVLVDGGMKEAKNEAIRLVNNTKGAILFNQFSDKNNALAHYYKTGPEIDESIDADYIFAGIGTGGTISGVGRYYKEKGFNTKIIGVEPFESPLITKGVANKHLIQGIGANFIPDILDLNVIDSVVTVKGKKAIDMAKSIRKIENIDCGYSSGASLLAAINYIKDNNISGKNIVVVFPDSGDRYIW